MSQSKDELGAAIVATNDLISEAQANHEDAVRRARKGGMTWVEIGKVLGTSRQGAWERFRHVEDED